MCNHEVAHFPRRYSLLRVSAAPREILLAAGETDFRNILDGHRLAVFGCRFVAPSPARHRASGHIEPRTAAAEKIAQEVTDPDSLIR